MVHYSLHRQFSRQIGCFFFPRGAARATSPVPVASAAKPPPEVLLHAAAAVAALLQAQVVVHQAVVADAPAAELVAVQVKVAGGEGQEEDAEAHDAAGLSEKRCQWVHNI